MSLFIQIIVCIICIAAAASAVLIKFISVLLNEVSVTSRAAHAHTPG